MAAMQYRLVQGDVNSFEENINQAGDEGWELHTVSVQLPLIMAIMQMEKRGEAKVW